MEACDLQACLLVSCEIVRVFKKTDSTVNLAASRYSDWALLCPGSAQSLGFSEFPLSMLAEAGLQLLRAEHPETANPIPNMKLTT